jgi:spore maturation protein CgeB
LADLKDCAHGHAGPAEFRRLVAEAGVNLCLVRRDNRDGHSMRSFELPAVGGCMLVENTAEHRDIFGPDGECVSYFDGLADIGQRAAALVAARDFGQGMAKRVRERIEVGRNTYADRLRQMIALLQSSKGNSLGDAPGVGLRS